MRKQFSLRKEYKNCTQEKFSREFYESRMLFKVTEIFAISLTLKLVIFNQSEILIDVSFRPIEIWCHKVTYDDSAHEKCFHWSREWHLMPTTCFIFPCIQSVQPFLIQIKNPLKYFALSFFLYLVIFKTNCTRISISNVLYEIYTVKTTLGVCDDFIFVIWRDLKVLCSKQCFSLWDGLFPNLLPQFLESIRIQKGYVLTLLLNT